MGILPYKIDSFICLCEQSNNNCTQHVERIEKTFHDSVARIPDKHLCYCGVRHNNIVMGGVRA